MSELDNISYRVASARKDVEARGETFYPGPSRVHVSAFPPKERWDDWVELESTKWPDKVERRYMLVPTTCFNCESACGLLAYVDKETLEVKKFEGNPNFHHLDQFPQFYYVSIILNCSKYKMTS